MGNFVHLRSMSLGCVKKECVVSTTTAASVQAVNIMGERVHTEWEVFHSSNPQRPVHNFAENIVFIGLLIQISVKNVSKYPIHNTSALVQITVWPAGIPCIHIKQTCILVYMHTNKFIYVYEARIIITNTSTKFN